SYLLRYQGRLIMTDVSYREDPFKQVITFMLAEMVIFAKVAEFFYLYFSAVGIGLCVQLTTLITFMRFNQARQLLRSVGGRQVLSSRLVARKLARFYRHHSAAVRSVFSINRFLRGFLNDSMFTQVPISCANL